VFLSCVFLSVTMESAFSSGLTPFSFLCYSTTSLGRFGLWASSVRLTEVPAFHGGGLALLPNLGSPLGLGAQFFRKFRIALFLIFLVV